MTDKHPLEAPSLSKPCPHPGRNGEHELYTKRDNQICRACGAKQVRDLFEELKSSLEGK